MPCSHDEHDLALMIRTDRASLPTSFFWTLFWSIDKTVEYVCKKQRNLAYEEITIGVVKRIIANWNTICSDYDSCRASVITYIRGRARKYTFEVCRAWQTSPGCCVIVSETDLNSRINSMVAASLAKPDRELQQLVDEEDNVAIRRAARRLLADLPESHFTLIFDRHLQDMSYKEMATNRGQNEDTTRRQTNRVLNWLRQELNGATQNLIEKNRNE